MFEAFVLLFGSLFLFAIFLLFGLVFKIYGHLHRIETVVDKSLSVPASE